ncbi:hypothetical protein ACA910_021955 [Epithemia clementina (nom. ined.)]
MRDRPPNRDEQRTNGNSTQQHQQQQETEQRIGIQPAHGQGYVEKSTGGERLRLDDLCKSTSKELAIKIRRWDELSANGSRKQGGAVEDQVSSSNATEELGSIMTPLEQQQQQVPASPRPPNLWDSTPPALLETSTQSAEGVEAVDPPRPVSPKRRERPVRLSPVNNQNMMNLSNDFDDAWVALPTSRFFQSSSPERPTSGSPRQQRAQVPNKPFSPVRSSDPSTSRRSREELEPTLLSNSRGGDAKPTRAHDQERIDKSQQYNSDFAAESAEEAPAGTGENTNNKNKNHTNNSNPKPKRRLRALLQRGRNGEKAGQASASVTTGSIAASTRRSTAQSEDEEAAASRRKHTSTNNSGNQNYKDSNSNNNNTNNETDNRGRSGQEKSEASRSRSLEERRVRNPNIARKFSRMLRVYGDEEKAYV